MVHEAVDELFRNLPSYDVIRELRIQQVEFLKELELIYENAEKHA